jgi:thiamine kinase
MPSPPDAILRRVPGLEDARPPLHVEALGGGTVNAVYRVDSPRGRFIVRLDGAAWRRPGVDRARELALHRVAAAAGIAPAVIVAAPEDHGLLITEFHDGRLWQAGDYEDAAALRQLGERLCRLHRLKPPSLCAFDPLQVGADYAGRVGVQHAAAGAEAMRRLGEAVRSLRRDERAQTVVHGDLWEGNLLQGERLWLLDWEYAQLTDPLMDVACVLAYYPRAQLHRRELLAAAGFDVRRELPALTARIDIYRMLSWLWRLARGEDVVPPAG